MSCDALDRGDRPPAGREAADGLRLREPRELTRRRNAPAAASLFDPGEVDRLAARARHGGRAGALEVVVDTELTLIDADGGLWFRGRDATELARFRSFEQVAALLWDAGDARAPWRGAGETRSRCAGPRRPRCPRAPDRSSGCGSSRRGRCDRSAARRPPARRGARGRAQRSSRRSSTRCPERSHAARPLDRGAAVVAARRRAAAPPPRCTRSTPRSSCSPTTSWRRRRSPRGSRRRPGRTPTSSC